MARIFEKDYKYLLASVIPQHRLSVERRRHIRTAVAGGDAAQIRAAAVLALEDLYDSQYFDRASTRVANGDVEVTYVRNEGSFQIQLVVPSKEWEFLGEDGATAKPRERTVRDGRTATVEKVPVETTINILPEIIQSFAIDGQRESSLHRLDSLLRVMQRGLRFTACRLVLVEERIDEREERTELVVTQREAAFQEKAVYRNCRQSRKTVLLDASEAQTDDIVRPGGRHDRSPGADNAAVAVAPIFSQDDFWGVLEVWFVGDDNGPLLQNRVEIASGIVARNIENTVQLDHLTSIDKLTGFYNKAFYERWVDIELERATRSGTKLSMLFLDIDNFSVINNSLGHLKGDEALVVVADLIRDNLRKIDSVFRWGGEEFVILLPGTPEMEAIHTAERLRAVIAGCEEFLDNGAKRRQITVSIGGAVFPDDARTGKELLHCADSAMYIAKEKGKNRVEFYRR